MPVDELPWTFKSIENKIGEYDGGEFRHHLLTSVDGVLMTFGYNPQRYYFPVERHHQYDTEHDRIDSINKFIDDILKMSEIIFQKDGLDVVWGLYRACNDLDEDDVADEDEFMYFRDTLHDLMSGMWFYGDKEKGSYTDLRLRFHRFKWLLEKGQPYEDPLQKS